MSQLLIQVLKKFSEKPNCRQVLIPLKQQLNGVATKKTKTKGISFGLRSFILKI